MNTVTRNHPAFKEPPTTGARPRSAPETVDVVVIGHTGQVGSALVSRLGRLGERDDSPALRFAEGINRRSRLILDQSASPVLQRDPGTLNELGARLRARGRPTVVVDCTADPDLPALYPEWLEAGIGVVTPNKHGFSADLGLYHRIQQAARVGNAPLAYSATVGAGLPILSSLRRLRRAGAVPARLSAVVSGTLAHVFAQMAAGQPLSVAVDDARERGFTEPDPLEDLSGSDVARKLVIMLREAGLDDIAVERQPVVADDWADQARQSPAVIPALRERDGEWRQRFESARAAGETWAYLAQFGPEGASVGPLRLDRRSPFARLGGSANLVRIELADDPRTPLEVRGPGAGVAVTAGSVLADLVDAAGMLCGPR